MNRNVRRLMAYFIMPLIFAIIGYSIIFIAAIPLYEIGYASLNIVLAEQNPDFFNSLNSVYADSYNRDHIEAELLSDGETQYFINIENVKIPEYGAHYAHLSCDRISLAAPVYYGDSNEILREGAGHYIGSFLPGFQGTTLLAGHNTTYFLPLQDIEIGDIITLSTHYADYEYEVIDLKVLHNRDDSAADFKQRDMDTLVMYTCYPFSDSIGIKQERLFVYTQRVSGPDIDEVSNAETD